MTATSGHRAIAVAVDAGFEVRGEPRPHPDYRWETVRDLVHPDGRVLRVVLGPGGDLVRALPGNRERWPRGVKPADSVPKVAELAACTEST